MIQFILPFLSAVSTAASALPTVGQAALSAGPLLEKAGSSLWNAGPAKMGDVLSAHSLYAETGPNPAVGRVAASQAGDMRRARIVDLAKRGLRAGAGAVSGYEEDKGQEATPSVSAGGAGGAEPAGPVDYPVYPPLSRDWPSYRTLRSSMRGTARSTGGLA